MTALAARLCAHCGKAKGVFAFTLVRNGKPESGYYHPGCFKRARAQAEAGKPSRAGPRSAKIHALYPNGLTTFCEKDPARCRWTRNRTQVNCPQCLAILEGLNAHADAK